jgi:hypothetical protein
MPPAFADLRFGEGPNGEVILNTHDGVIRQVVP